MTPYYADDLVTLHLGGCLDVMAGMPGASVDAVVCDPPYGLAEIKPETVVTALTAWLGGDRMHVPDGRGFMGAEWDKFVPPPGVWDECLRVLKPGGHLLAFAAPRTADLMGLSIRLAGLEVRDSLHWIYGSGFLPCPKSHDVSKAIDKAAGAQREVVGNGQPFGRGSMRNRSRVEQGYRPTEVNPNGGTAHITAPATEDAARWSGWGTATKPAHEPVIVARKPLSEGTVAANVLRWGTGALNVDGCRVVTAPEDAAAMERANTPGSGRMKRGGSPIGTFVRSNPTGAMDTTAGRWPPNLLLTHSASCNGTCAPGCPVAGLDGQSGTLTTHAGTYRREAAAGSRSAYQMDPPAGHVTSTGDSGGASRFFPQFTWDPEHDLPFMYCAKAPKSERPRLPDGTAHPTVKPLALMRWLVRLITPPGGLVLDPFAGSGTTTEAARLEGFRAIGIELHEHYAELATRRLSQGVLPQT